MYPRRPRRGWWWMAALRYFALRCTNRAAGTWVVGDVTEYDNYYCDEAWESSSYGKSISPGCDLTCPTLDFDDTAHPQSS